MHNMVRVTGQLPVRFGQPPKLRARDRNQIVCGLHSWRAKCVME